MIKRLLFDKLKNHLSKKEISLIIGPRQSGKTTLMLLLKDYLLKSKEKVVFFNLDVESDRIYFSSQEKLINKIKLELGSNKGYVFIDEIQRKENAGLFLKGIYDLNLQYKFIISGSGSLDLKEKIHESLVGRKRIFMLTTVNFIEFVNYRTEYRYEDRIFDFFKIENSKTNELLNEYLHFGGYPKIVTEETVVEKRKEMDEIYQSYIEKDISYLLNVQNVEKISNLIKLLASQIGRLMNYSEYSNTLNLSFETLKKYLWYLEKIFIVNKVTPFYKNIRKEITKSPIYYFHDLGLRNYALNLFNGGSVLDLGFVFQNFVYNVLRDVFAYSSILINFWRTLDKAKVDFIISSGNNHIPVEVKYKFYKCLEVSRSFRSFIEKYNPKMAFVINLNYKDSIKIGNTKVIFLPFYELWQINNYLGNL